MGVSSVGTQFRCSFWRQYLGHLRQWPWVLGALVVALMPFALLAGLKSTAPPEHVESCHFESRGLSTEWPLGQLQSFVCGLANECHNEGQDDLLDHYPGAAINELINATYLIDGSSTMLDRLFALPWSLNLLKGVTDLITAPALTALMENGLQVSDIVKSPSELALKLTSEHDLDPEVVQAFLESRINVSRVFSLAGLRGPREAVCSPQYLGEFLVTNDTDLITDISWSLCHLPFSQAANVTSVFLSSLDPGKLMQKAGEFVEAVGGFKAEVLVRQVGRLLAAMGHLEALEPLTSHLPQILEALDPVRNAIKVMSLSMWDEISFGEFLGFVESVVRSFTANSSVVMTELLEESSNAALHLISIAENPANFTRQLEGPHDPWEAVVKEVGVAMEAVVGKMDAVLDYLRQHPILRSMLSLASTGISILLHSQPYNTTNTPRLDEKLGEALTILLEVYQTPLNGTVATTLLPALYSAAAFINAADAMSSLAVQEPPLPLFSSLGLLTLVSNCSRLKSVVEGEGLDSWLCGESLDLPSVDDQQTLSERFCSDDGKAELRNITQLLQNALSYSQVTQDNFTVAGAVEGTMALLRALDSSTYLHQALFLHDTVLTPSVDLEWWRKWHPKTMVVEEVEGNDSQRLLPLLPPLGSEGFQDLEEGVKGSKDIIHKLVTIYLNLVGGKCGDASGALASVLSPGHLEDAADMVTSVLDTLVHMAALTQEPWRLSDLLRHPNVTTFLTRVLPSNVMVVVTRALEVAQSPWVEVPAPIPQLLALLNATHSALNSVLETNDVWAWCAEGSCPHLANLTSHAHLLPHLAALQYYTSVMSPGKDKMQILTNYSAWRYYPCQNSSAVPTPASLSLFYPAISFFIPAAQPTIKKVKQEVRDLEEYICENFDAIVDELTSNEELTGAVKAFMDHLTPERINLGAAVSMMRSLWKTVTHIDTYEIMTNLTRGLLSLEDWSRPYSYLAVNGSVPERVVKQLLESVLETLMDETKWNGTHIFPGNVNMALHAAHNITTALTDTLWRGDITLAEILGISESDPLFSLLVQGPEGLSDYLLHEMNTFIITAIIERDVESWTSGLCNRSRGVTPWVEVICDYTLGETIPDFLLSNVSEAVTEALTQLHWIDAPQPPPMSPSQLISDIWDLKEALQQFDFTKPPDTTALDLLMNTTQREVDKLLAGVRAMQADWPFLFLDAVVQKGPVELQSVLRETDFALLLLLIGIPSPFDNTTSPAPQLYQVVNETWVDLVAGIHYNLLQNIPLENLTKENVCAQNTTLKEPEGGDGSFLEAVKRLCQGVDANVELFDKVEQIQNTSFPVTSTKAIYWKITKVMTLVDEYLHYKRNKELQDVLGWPSYFVKDNWRTLLARIYPNTTDGITTKNLEELVPSLVVALRWLRLPQNSTLPRNMLLQVKWMNLMMAGDLKEMLNTTSVLSDLADTITQTLPLAMKDLVDTLKDQPNQVGKALVALKEVRSWMDLCQLNISAVGSNLTTLQGELCQLQEEELIDDLRNLLGLDLLRQQDPTFSLEESLKSLTTYIATVDNIETVGTRLVAPDSLVEYLGLQRWMDLPSDVFNVTAKEMERNGTMILAAVLGPLVALGEQQTEEGLIIKTLLLSVTQYLRETRWMLVASSGNLREAYMDKPMVIHFLDLLDQLPEIAKEYIAAFGQFSTLSEAVKMRTIHPCALHSSFLKKLAEEGNEGIQLLNNTIHFLCDNSTQLFLLYQLQPNTLPVIMGEFMGMDAATLAHLVTDVGRVAVDVLNRRHTRIAFYRPPWLAVDRWEDVYLELRRLLDRPVMEMVLDVAFLGLSAVQTHTRALWVKDTLPTVASVVYQVSQRLADSINETSGSLDLRTAVKDLGSVEQLIAYMANSVPTHVALAMWFPESYANWRLVRGDHLLEMLDEMCEKGPQHLLLHPGLPQYMWEHMRHMFCNFSLPELRHDLMPLLNVTDVMDGEMVDMNKVRQAVENMVSRVSVLNMHQLEEPFIKNAFTLRAARIHPALRVVGGVLGQLIWLQRNLQERMSRGSQNIAAHSMVLILSSIEPLAREGSQSLLERLQDPDQLMQLVNYYQNFRTHALDKLFAMMNFTESQNNDTYPLYGHVYSELYNAVTIATENLMPATGLGMPFGEILQSIMTNVYRHGGQFIKIAGNSMCYNFYGEVTLDESWASIGQWMEVGEEQLERVDEYVDLICRAPNSNLTHLLRTLWEDLGWKDQVMKLTGYGEEWNTTIGCTTFSGQVISAYDKFVEVVHQYEINETARTRVARCLGDAFSSNAGQQFVGLMVAIKNFLNSVSKSEDLTNVFFTFLEFTPNIARALSKLSLRMHVMVPLQEVLVINYDQKMNMSSRVLEATRNLMVDVNRIYPGDEDELVALSETIEGMQKWLKILEGEGADSGLTWDTEDKETPLEVLFKFAQSRGADVFVSQLMHNVEYADLMTEVHKIRLKAVISLVWLDPIISHLEQATDSLISLSQSGSIGSLKKMMTGEEDPLTFLSGSVKFIQKEEWNHLAQSFKGLLEEGVPLITGSQLGEDLQSVVDGVNSILEARDMGLMDFKVPLKSLVVNWTGLEDYLLKDLRMEPRVVEALSTSDLNLLALMSLEGTTVEEVLCQGHQMGRLVVLPTNTQVTPAQISSAVCSSNDPLALTSSFISQINLTPLMTMLTQFGVNASLSSHGMSLGEVVEAVKNVAEASEYVPKILTTMRAFHNLSTILTEAPKARRLVDNSTGITIRNITSPEFLDRAGQVLCGRPLTLMPDKFHLQDLKRKTPSTEKDLDVCDRLYEDIRTLPGGGLLLHYVKPLLRGKVFFTPDNSITRAIIAKANETFSTVDRQHQHLRRLSEQAKGITSTTSIEDDLKKLEEALKLPWVQGTMKDLFHSVSSPLSPLNLSSLPDFSTLTAKLKERSPQLLESSKLVTEFSDVLEVGVSLMSCLQLKRFVPVHNESELLEEARWALDEREFLAGIVFNGVGQSGSTDTALPANLTYTIRVDYSKSPPTFLLGPKFWRPGPYADMAFYMRYQQGFIQLQETLENAILKLQHQQAKAGESGMGQRRKRSAGSPLPLTEEEEDLLLNLPVHTKQQPYPCYTKDDFLQMVNESPVMSFIFSFLALVLFSTFIIQQLVQEKESRNKQLQEVMGLRLWLDHLVWLLCSLLLLLVIVLLSALVLSLGNLQPRANFGVLMAFLFCYGLSVVSFCYLVACLVPTTVLAVFTGVMGLLVFNIPFVSISVIQVPVPLTVLLLTSLLPSTAFGFGFRIICQYELVEQGANYANMWIPPTAGSDMTLGLAIIMLVLDSVLFFVITLITTYLRNDIPRYRLNRSEGGSEPAPKRSSFMQHFSGKRTNDFALNMFPAYRAMDSPDAFPDSKVTPSEDDVISIKKEAIHVVDLDLGLKQSLRKGLSITGLRKIYHQGGSGSRVAVDGLTLDLYEGQVLALLGHNGAGKTTIISMLTHEMRPTAGKILVYGNDISTSEGWEKARQMIGLCPQESVLFPILTVEETLAYYTTLKQHSSDPPPTKVSTLLANMGLLEHRFFLAHQLSEGLRRRLCMAMAFVGHSKLVVLDEPTSGVDPATRSAMWEVISNNRSGRTILLTTHHLDEAETLADRVAVLHKGRLMCVGSPLALKSEYGLGYSITLSKASPPAPSAPSEIKADSLQAFKEKTALSYSEVPFKVLKTSNDGFGGKDGSDGDKKDKVWELLTQYVPNARLLESVNGEVTYSLPIHDSLGNTNRLSELFGELEGHLGDLGYTSLELRPTSLEDVIIALSTINAFESTSNRSSIKVERPMTSQKDLTTKYDFSLDHAECWVGLRRMAALLHKRLLHHSRDWHFYAQMFILPFLFILLAMVASKLRPSFSNATPITLEPSLYPPPATTFLRTLDPILGPLAEEVTQLSLGVEDRTGNWSSCPELVSDTNPGLEQCGVAESSVQSSCQCVDERCVVDATGQPSLNNWILATRTHHVQTRHAGISLGVKDPRQGETGRSGAMVWYDNSAYHALPTYINLLNNARLRRLAGPGHSITAINHPIVFSMHGIWSMSIQQHVADLGIGLLVLVALTVVCAATVGCMVAERVRGERRLLHLAGLSKKTYWIGSALWDTGVVVVNILLISLIFVAFKEQQFIWRENLWAFVILALLYGLSILPLFYLLEGWFRTEASAVFFFFCSFFGVGLITTLMLVVCQVMSYIKGMNDTAAVIKYLFLVFPPFTFTCSLKDMAASYTRASILARFDIDLYQSPFTWDPELQGGLGVYMVALSLWVVVGWVMLLCPRPAPRPAPLPLAGEAEEDKDVAAERIKIQRGGTSLYDTVLRLVGLGRDFSSPPITAVGNLFLALRRGECFSLLGLNGAGKTTTFRCLTGDLQPSRGQILINGLLLEEALELSRPIISYCPQSHALDPNLTSQEVLTNMARMKGASGPRTKKVVQQAIKQLGLSAEANTFVRHLSGGNKRKLSVALSLLGNPFLVLMDEPTTGMDPSSRRLVWRAIQSVSQDGRSVLLTSHSMDEVNQLSHRMAIMVNGQFVCLGSPHYLKDRLGDKYTVRLKTHDIEDMTYVVDYLRSHLMDVLLKEQHHLSLVVEVSRQLPLQLIFDTLNGAKSLGVTEYDVSQTTLNEVFRVLTSYQGDGFAPLPLRRISQSPDSIPSLLPHQHPAGTKPSTKNPTFHRQSVLAPVDCANPTDPYGNFRDLLEGRGKGGSPSSENGSANDSPEEVWTHL